MDGKVSWFKNYGGGNDKGTKCEKCQQKIDDHSDSKVGISTILKLVEHVRNCSGKPQKNKDNNDKGWPPNWLNKCANCEKAYKEAQEKVQAEPNRYELKERSECVCCHKINRIYCNIGPNCSWKSIYIDENMRELDNEGRKHHEVCGSGESQGGSSIPFWAEFYKVKLGQICEKCQKTINSLGSWEVKAKEQIAKDCLSGRHHIHYGGWVSQGGEGSYSTKIMDGNELHCGDKPTIKNSFGDIKPCPRCSKNNSPSQQQVQIFLSTLIQLQHFITANNIHSITNQNGNLVITFNTNNTPPQTINAEQLSEKNSTMDTEQKTMWQKFKEYLVKTKKNKMDKQELEQEIQKLKNGSETEKPTSKTPLIIGGIVVGVTLIIGLIFILRNQKKTRKL